MVQTYYQELIAGLPLQVVAIDQSRYTKTVEKLARKLHNGDLKPEELDEDLIRQTYGDLTKAIDQSWKDRFKFGDNPDSDRTVLALQRHLFRFSAAKTHSQLQAMNQLLHKDGKLREWADFKKEVAKVNTDFNQNYLQAEFQTARQAGHHARKWQGYVKDKDLFPNLEYQTTADERVRQEHAALDGIIKPIEDPFWDKYYPPNGWRCRCYVVPSDDGVSPERTIPKGQDIKPEFKGNVGKTGTVWGQKHPYFMGMTKQSSDRASALEKKAFNRVPEGIEGYQKFFGIEINKEVFKLLKDPITVGRKDIAKTGAEAYYSPKLKYIKFSYGNRFKDSPWLAEAVVYHETAHAIDHQKGLRSSQKIKDLMDKYRKRFAKKKDAEYKTISGELFGLSIAHAFENDSFEQVVSTSDTLMALNSSYGEGHSKAYFARKGFSEAEFIAHAFENKFIGNPIFKRLMPELYQDMIDWVDELYEWYVLSAVSVNHNWFIRFVERKLFAFLLSFF